MGDDFESTFIHEGEESLDHERLLREFAEAGMTGDRYTISGKIAQGGMGAIYKVSDQGLRRESVLKVMLPEVMENKELFARFVEEARITGQLEHPNIIPVHDLGVLEGERLYFSMKFIEGEELRNIMRNIRDEHPDFVKRYSLFSLLTIFRKVCDAVAFAHSRGIIHRDIKPDNIMVGEYGEVLLVDWGLARPITKDENQPRSTSNERLMDTRLGMSLNATRDGIIKGTPAYMSPEQAKGETDKIDPRTDIFLLGATLYAIATLRTPYSGDDIYEILTNAENANFPHPQHCAPHRHIPDALSDIILRSMAYHPDDRYQTVEELCEDVDALLEGRAVSVEKFFPAGSNLMEEGEEGDEAYVIVAGEVEVTKRIGRQQVTLMTLGEGATVGEMALISKATRSATVTAVRDTHVVVITSEVMKTALDKLPPWMGKCITAMVARLREANQNVHPLNRGDCTYHVLNQLRYLYPYAGVAATLPDESVALTLPFDTIIHEIAFNLSISTERVGAVFACLLEAGLAEALDDDHFYLPNYNLLCDFSDYVREVSEIKSPVAHERFVSFFASAHELAVSMRELNHESAPEDLHEVVERSAEDVIGCHDFDDIPMAFARILEQIRSELGVA